MQKIFVGDVQGCADELDELVERATQHFGDAYCLWLVGDLVNRGPANLRVLRRVRALHAEGRARVVLGNHDLALLRCALGLSRPGPRDTTSEILEQPDLDEWADWLRRLPVAEVGELSGEPFVMVHAALHPDWDLDDVLRRARKIGRRLAAEDRQDAVEFLSGDPARDRLLDHLERMTHCRSTRGNGTWSSAIPSAQVRDSGKWRPWHQHWRARKHDYAVVYGHWALQGLHVAEALRGLDTGCVHHGRGHDGFLTAWLPNLRSGEASAFSSPDDRFWQIPARRQYYGLDEKRDKAAHD